MLLGVNAVVERPRTGAKLLRSVTGFVLQPTQEGELRRRALFWVPAPLPVLGLVHLLVGGTFSASGWTILLATSVGVGTLLLALVVQPTPLPEGLSPMVSARRSLHRFRQFTALRIALALVPVVIGAAASIIGGGMYPLFAALALAWPQILLALPTFFTITKARRAMEAWGTTAYLWHALSRPAKVTWPIVTPLAHAWRTWRAERAVARDKARRDAELRRSEQEERDRARDPRAVPTTTSTQVESERTVPAEESPAREETDTPLTEVVPEDGAGPVPSSPEGSDGPTTGPMRSVGRPRMNRAQQFLARGGSLGLGVRQGRRNPQSTRRPPSHKP